jgi:hypothetical protein
LFAREGHLSAHRPDCDGRQAAAIAADLPAGLRVVPATQQRDTVAQLTDAFRLNLTALSLARAGRQGCS